MLIAVTVFVLIIGIVCICIYENSCKFNDDWICILGGTLAILAAIAFLIEILMVAVCNIGVSAKTEGWMLERESLVYQLENNFYDNDNDYGKKELYGDILEYNQFVAKGKIYKDNLWMGTFYPDELYDALELIELPTKDGAEIK